MPFQSAKSIPYRNACWLFVLLLLAGGCRSAAKARPFDRAALPADCEALRNFMVLNPGIEPDKPPRPTRLVLPPRDVSTRTTLVAEMLVTHEGQVDPASIMIGGRADRELGTALTERFASYRFRPAELNGCAVPAKFRMTFELGG